MGTLTWIQLTAKLLSFENVHPVKIFIF